MLEKRISFNADAVTNRDFMIKNMLNKNYDHKDIANIAGLSEKETEDIIKAIKARK